MKKYWIVVILLLITPLLNSCESGLIFVLYNNTDTDLAVWTSPKSSIEIIPGQSAEITLQNPQWIDFGMIGQKYELASYYNLKDFIYKKRLHNEIKAQAESNGEIYLLMPNTNFPAQRFPTQPKGFPLIPAHTADLT